MLQAQLKTSEAERLDNQSATDELQRRLQAAEALEKHCRPL